MRILPTRNTPRWIIFMVDLGVCSFAFIIAYLIRFEFSVPSIEIELAKAFFPIFISIRALSFVLGRTYAGIIRYTSTQDTMRIFVVLTSGSILFAGLNQIFFRLVESKFLLPNSIIIIEYLLSLFAMIVSRIAVKVVYLELKTPSRVKKRIVIFGAGEGGMITKRTMDRDSNSDVEVIAFFDDDKRKTGKKLEGTDIYYSSKLIEFFSSGKIDEVVIAITSLPQKRRAEIIEEALKFNVRVRQIPPATKWIGGELSNKQIRDIKIEDLLGRESINLDDAQLQKELSRKTVLITGAAGSIGSELARQCLGYGPKKLILLDQAESALFDLENELYEKDQERIIEVVIADVRQEDRIRRVMEYFKPQMVYHASAYKHVPLMENNPSEAVLTNVKGTKVVADLAEEFHCEKFVLISTDKAVNPTSVMGSTKRVAEMYVQSKNKVSKTAFITTRFGNVLGSNGSVIPIFKKQIEQGGPITITHPEITRFFMTIPEAVQLVLQAGQMGKGGEIFAFDMGESVRIVDLAINMIKLSGLEIEKDIQLKFTGLRPGEKLYEEVLSDKENAIPTPHPKILIAKVREYSFEETSKNVQDLIELFSDQNNEALVRKLKSIIPEYLSNNSEFEKLDR